MRRHRWMLALALLGALVLGTAPVADARVAHQHVPCPKNIVQTARAAGDFSTLLSLVQQAGLTDTLAHGGPFTVFAPTNEAFAKLPQSTLDSLASNPALLKKILLYHVVSGKVSSSQAATAGAAATVEGENVTFTALAGGGLEVNQSTVVAADIQASNGVIHAIDTVLTPPSLAPQTIVQTAVAAGQFTTLVKLLQATGLDSVLAGPGPFTVFAPTDAAFAKLPPATLASLGANPALLKKILLYHVVSGSVSSSQAASAGDATTVEGEPVTFTRTAGGGLQVDEANVVTPDIQASNGVIHAIDTVLMPPSLGPDIVQTAVAAGQFTTLVKLLQATGLDSVLAGPGPFTVFAPTDAAFAKLPPSTLAALGANPALLKKVLLYHVVSGEVLAADAAAARSATTVEGDKVFFSRQCGPFWWFAHLWHRWGASADTTAWCSGLRVNDARIIEPNVLASNGVIHVIDTVLMPPAS